MIQTAKQPFGFAMLLNANYADGIDTSWIWDGNFEEFVASKKPPTTWLAASAIKILP